jgi:leader peptidase (prepilin peptidase) / N-methyltransferase
MIFLPLLIFVFGLIIGSFLNVVILRMNTGRSIARGRSKCAHCNRVLAWYELIPVFSFLGLRGKCRTCNTEISFQYALVELVTAITFVVAYIKIVINGGFTIYSWIAFAFSLVISALLMVIFVYDLRHKIVPDTVVFPFILLALLSILWKSSMVPGFLGGNALVNGVVVALPFFLLWFFSKGRFMGFGDVKLALGIGWLLGLAGGFAAILLSFWFGGIAGLFLIAISKKYGMKSEVPFAPFLIMGVFIAGFWGVTITTLLPIWQ